MDPRRFLPVVSFCGLLLLSACKKEEITTYRVPKEPDQPAMSAQATSGMPAPSADHPSVQWTLPSGWREQQPSAMRTGSFLAKGKDGSDVDISVVVLGGNAGGDLANVNRWRDQIGLPPLDENSLEKNSHWAEPRGHRMRWVDFTSHDNLISGQTKKRVVGVIYARGDQTWFFKMTGSEAAVGSLQPGFRSFLESLRFKEGSPA